MRRRKITKPQTEDIRHADDREQQPTLNYAVTGKMNTSKKAKLVVLQVIVIAFMAFVLGMITANIV